MTDGVDRQRFPNFAALARDATWYRNATTVADGTTYAVPAILSGTRPTDDRLPIASDYPTNLFTALGDGYALNVEEPATDLCPTRLCGADERPSATSRMRALFDDLTVVSGHCSCRRAWRPNCPRWIGPSPAFATAAATPGAPRPARE